jgi:hypothetical protein
VGLGIGAIVVAQLSGPTHSAVAADSTVPAGSAIATGSVFGAVPIVGNTNLSLSAGDSSASYQESESRSSSQTLDLGGVGVILANTPVCGQIVLPAERQPPPLTDDSDGGPPTATNDLPGAGNEAVAAAASPESASATTTPVGQQVAGLLTVSGQATSSVQYTGAERQAQSTVILNMSVSNGLVALQGMTWSAIQNSGGTAVSQGTFSVGSIKVGPLTFPAPSAAQLAIAIGLANKALATLGLTLIPPSTTTDPTTGTVTVTPLEITLGKSALSNVAISPIISQTSALESALAGQTQSGNDCANPKVLVGNLASPGETVANVALGAFANGGGFDLDLGGATADTSAPPDFADPFGSGDSSSNTGGSLPPDALGQVDGGSGLPLGVGLGSVVPGGTGTTSTSEPAQPIAGSSALAAATHCETTSPAGHPSCWSGDAMVVGIVAVGAGAALFLADLRKSRRSRRQRTEEVLA